MAAGNASGSIGVAMMRRTMPVASITTVVGIRALPVPRNRIPSGSNPTRSGSPSDANQELADAGSSEIGRAHV